MAAMHVFSPSSQCDSDSGQIPTGKKKKTMAFVRITPASFSFSILSFPSWSDEVQPRNESQEFHGCWCSRSLHVEQIWCQSVYWYDSLEIEPPVSFLPFFLSLLCLCRSFHCHRRATFLYFLSCLCPHTMTQSSGIPNPWEDNPSVHSVQNACQRLNLLD